MLQRMRREGLTPQELVNRVKDKSNNRRLMGFGHRIYHHFDPRSKILRKAAERLLNSMKIDDPLLGMAQELADIALNDDYFIERHLYPNVDFYSGVILRAIDIPLNMYTIDVHDGTNPAGSPTGKKSTIRARRSTGRGSSTSATRSRSGCPGIFAETTNTGARL